MPWVLNEDGALKARLSGIHLEGHGEVPVRFSTPETESESADYPSIIITRKDVLPAKDREHRGTVSIDYGPEGGVLPGEDDRWGWYAQCPLPYNVDYQVLVRARFQAHTTKLAQIIASERYLPYRFGYLEIPQRNTWASMDLIGGPAFTDSRDDDDMRVFEIHYLVRVFSEMTPWDIDRLTFPDIVDGTVFDAGGKTLAEFETSIDDAEASP